MAQTAIAVQKITTAAAGPIVAFRCAGAARDARVFEVGITAATAVSGTVGLGRPASAGTSSASVGPTAANFGYDNVAGAGAAVIDTTWSVAPTAPAIPWRRFVLPATIGAGLIWRFPNGIVVPAGGTLMLWQFSALAVTYETYFEADE